MKRGLTGQYETTWVGGEQVRAFVPESLPPAPPLEITPARQRLLERATLALGQLDGISRLPPEPGLFLYSYVRRYVGAEAQQDDDELFEQKMARLVVELRKQQAKARWLDEAIWKNLKELGYDC